MPIYADWIRCTSSPYFDALAGDAERPVAVFEVQAQTRTPGDGDPAFETDLMHHLAQNAAGVHAWTDGEVDGSVPTFDGPIPAATDARLRGGYVAVLADPGPPPEYATLGDRVPRFSHPRCAVVVRGAAGAGLAAAAAAKALAARLWRICATTHAMTIPGPIAPGAQP